MYKKLQVPPGYPIRTSTLDFWRFYGVACGIAMVLGWTCLSLISCFCAIQILKLSIHLLTTYLAVISVFCFWGKEYFLGAAFAIGAFLQFLYVVSVIDRLPFTMLVLQRAMKMLSETPGIIVIACIFPPVMLLWLALWTFGVSGPIALGFPLLDWFFIMVFSSSLFCTGAVLCNVVHVVVSGIVYLALIHGGRESESMPAKPVMSSLRYAVTTLYLPLRSDL